MTTRDSASLVRLTDQPAHIIYAGDITFHVTIVDSGIPEPAGQAAYPVAPGDVHAGHADISHFGGGRGPLAQDAEQPHVIGAGPVDEKIRNDIIVPFKGPLELLPIRPDRLKTGTVVPISGIRGVETISDGVIRRKVQTHHLQLVDVCYDSRPFYISQLGISGHDPGRGKIPAAESCLCVHLGCGLACHTRYGSGTDTRTGPARLGIPEIGRVGATGIVPYQAADIKIFKSAAHAPDSI